MQALQELVQLSTHPTYADGKLEPRAVDLRAFVLQSRIGGQPQVEVLPSTLSRTRRCSEEASQSVPH